MCDNSELYKFLGFVVFAVVVLEYAWIEHKNK